MPKVSICIPAYKNPTLLKKALDSVLEQTFTDYEVIITDDSPNEDVGTLVKEYGLDKNISYYKNPVPLGSPENWNKSIELAKGEYIKILHHDDWFTDQNSLKQFVELLDENPDADFGFSSSKAVLDERKDDYTYSVSNETLNSIRGNNKVLFHSNYIGAPSATIYRNGKNFYFDKNLKWLVDVDFYICLTNQNPRIVHTFNPLISIYGGTLGNRVTGHCINNFQVEIFEYFHVYNKIKKRGGINLKLQIVLINVIKRYENLNKETVLDLISPLEIPCLIEFFFIIKSTGFLKINDGIKKYLKRSYLKSILSPK